jgi:hypothetical protein
MTYEVGGTTAPLIPPEVDERRLIRVTLGPLYPSEGTIEQGVSSAQNWSLASIGN